MIHANTDPIRPFTFGQRKLVPSACIADARHHIRTFFSEALEEFGFITGECDSAGQVHARLRDRALDLFVIGFSAGGPGAAEVIQALAAASFSGKVLLIGNYCAPALMAVHELGNELGLSMLPALGFPYSNRELRERIVSLLPKERPPSPPVDVEEALRQDWLEMWYQAKVDVRTCKLAGAEALIRMRHPTWGIVPPAYFIPADGDPHFAALSEFVIARAIQDWHYFVAEGVPLELAINLPVPILQDTELVKRMRLMLPDHPAFHRLIVEINGTEVLRDLPLAQEIAKQLRFYNIGLSIDDLGAEWSSFEGLRHFPFIELKVDQKFITGCADDPLKQAVCRTIIDLARRFDTPTVAEGVETEADFAAVRDLGFDLAQGFLFGKAMEPKKFARTMLRPLTVPH
jgi:EAL domain-containing protein (putative c-di-GMP-specific phosphodiesterase class I)